MARSDERPVSTRGGPATLPFPNQPIPSVGGMSRKSLIWVLAALLGIVLTAAITWASSQLTSQRIGLSSEPISAGVRLAPSVHTTTTHSVTTTHRVSTTRHVQARPSQTTTTTVILTRTAPVPTPVQTVPRTSVPARRTGEDGTRGRGGSAGRRDD